MKGGWPRGKLLSPEHRRAITGSGNGNAKLDEEKVAEIFPELNDVPSHIVAEAYEIAPSNVRRIRNGWSWNHVTGLPRRSR